MGKMMKILATAAVVVASFGTARAEATAYWEYDASTTPQTISDGEWTIAVESLAECQLRIGPGQNSECKPRAGDGRTTRPWAMLAEYAVPEHGRLDLSKPVYTKGTSGDAAEVWRITEIAWNAFCDLPAVKSLTAPKTLTSCAGQAFMGMANLTEAVFDCPELTGVFGDWGSEFGGTPLTKLILKMPNVSRIGRVSSVANFSGATFTETDVSDWDLTGVTVLGIGALQAGNWSGVGPTGTIRLPKVETIDRSAFYRWSRLETAELGTSGSLKSLGMTLFGGNHGSTKSALRKVDFGESFAFTVDPQAFYLDVKDEKGGADTPLSIEEVWFAARAPKAEVLDNILALRTVDEDGSKPVKIYAPVYKEGWAELCQPFTDAEAEAAAALTVEDGTIVGVYETQGGRRVAWFVQRSDMMEPTWDYDAEAGTISDGYWTVRVEPTATAGELKVVATGDLLTGNLSGALELYHPIYTKGTEPSDATRWTIVAIADNAFKGTAANLTSFTAPKTLVSWGSSVFNGVATLKAVILDCPNLTGSFGPNGGELGASDITLLVLKTPKLTSFGNTTNNKNARNFGEVTFDQTDVSDWDLSGVRTIYDNGLQAGARWNKKLDGGPTGALNLPNVESIGAGAFDCWTRVSSMALGTSGSLKSLGKTLAWNPDAKSGLGAGPTKIDFGASWDFTVHAQAFYAEFKGANGCNVDMPLPLKEIWFADRAPSRETLDRILVLQNLTEDGMKPIKIYAPVRRASWAAITSSMTDDETALAAELVKENPKEEIVGVYETSGTDGQPRVRVAWLVQNPNIKSSFCIRIR